MTDLCEHCFTSRIVCRVHQPRLLSNYKYSFLLLKLKRKWGVFVSLTKIYTYIHTYHSRFIPEGVAEVSQIFLRDTHVLPKFVSYEENCERDRW
jgi:hypothetical protein